VKTGEGGEGKEEGKEGGREGRLTGEAKVEERKGESAR